MILNSFFSEKCKTFGSDLCFEAKIKEIVVKMGDKGTNDDVTVTFCPDTDTTQVRKWVQSASFTIRIPVIVWMICQSFAFLVRKVEKYHQYQLHFTFFPIRKSLWTPNYSGMWSEFWCQSSYQLIYYYFIFIHAMHKVLKSLPKKNLSFIFS